jgi:hypothetical protein
MPEERLHTETWSWTLDRTDEGLLLSVVCGTVGLYERSLLLTPEEVSTWEQSGPAGREPLVEAIRNDVTDTVFGNRYL